MAGAGGNWSWGKKETDLVSLYEYLDSQNNYVSDKRGLVFASITIVAYMAAVLATVSYYQLNHFKIHNSPWMLFGTMGGATVLAGLTCAWYFLSVPDEVREHRRNIGAAQTFIWKLYAARWQGNIKGLVGEDAALALNGAAYDFLRCRSTLQSSAWRGLSSDSPWVATRDKASMAMEAAMARLMTMIGQGGSPQRPEIQRLLSDMRLVSEEIAATSEKLALSKGISGDVSNDLRQVLGEMRALNDAQDEVMNLDRLL